MKVGLIYFLLKIFLPIIPIMPVKLRVDVIIVKFEIDLESIELVLTSQFL